MKYIKKFENSNVVKKRIYPDYNVGDIVVVIDSYNSLKNNIKNDDRCVIISLDCSDDENHEYVKLESLEDGLRCDYHKRRIISEDKYNAIKYNI